MFELLSAGYKTERGFMKKGEIYEGIIEKVEFPNKGFVWVDDQKVIVKNGIPGQKVRFMINKKRSGRAEGRLLEVLEKSPLETREPACQEFPACGGCMYQTMSYEAQKDMKEHQVRELLDGAVRESLAKIGKNGDGTEEAEAAEGEEVLTVWCWDPNFNVYAMKQAEAIYQKDHPDFKLDIQEKVYSDIETALITAAEADDYSTLPDIFLMQDYSFHKNVANYSGIFTELTDSGIDFSNFSAGKLADSTVDGKNYGVPFDNGATIMAIRKDMVEAAGLTVDDFKDTTWSDFIEKAKKVVETNNVPMLTSSGGSEIIIEMLQSAGASPMVDGKVDLVNNKALKKAIETYKQLIDEGIMVDYTDWDQYIASMNKGTAAGVIQGCWIMSSIQAADDQAGKWSIVNMPKLDDVEGATNYANCGGASWAVSSNCKNTDLAYDFLKTTFGGSVELYDDLLPNAGAIASYLPAAESEVYNEASDFYAGQAVYKDIVDFAGKVPGIDYGAYYSDVRSALTDAITNVVQNGADIDSEIKNAQDTVEFNVGE